MRNLCNFVDLVWLFLCRHCFEPEILRITLPSFVAQSISDLGAASLDAAHCGHQTPSIDVLALYFESRDKMIFFVT